MAVDPGLTPIVPLAATLAGLVALALTSRAGRAHPDRGAGSVVRPDAGMPSDGEVALIPHPAPARWIPAVHAALIASAGAFTASTWGEVLAWVGLAAGLGWLVVIDVASKRLPDALVAPLYPWLIVTLGIASFEGAGWNRYWRALLAGLICLVACFALAWISPWGMGLGDVKLSGALGIAMGWFGRDALWTGVASAIFTNALVGVFMLVTRRGTRRSEYPFGPHMVLGMVVGIALHFYLA